ncbi:zinc metalloprotease [Nonomuraea sp. NPDC050786]|uniref:zinc metalloprotease n=1 Tax=Nonomuraea sp. NPDC050786 TaxID=3154840 RepID=UPI0033E26A80
MARRVAAVSLACLLAAGHTPPLRPEAAHAAGCAAHAQRGPWPRSPRPEDVAKVASELARRLGGVTPPSRITVPTWVHIITAGPRRVSDQDVAAQIKALNSAYAGGYGGVDTGVRFKLEGVTVHENALWFTDPIGNERPMKAKLHRGDAATLNLYIAQLNAQMLGFASYPFWYAGSPGLDGVVIDWRSLPGGPMAEYNRGFTGVHEVGHWLGLFHPFENGCAAPGDGIDDTPMEAGPTEGCPPEKDTCANPGADPTRNFMDYAYDRCMSEFTRAQAERMHEMWVVYRHVTSA